MDMSSAKVSLLKLRVAYGKTGSDTDPYNVLNILNKTNISLGGEAYTAFPFGGVGGYSISNTLRNNKLRPEISTETEFGTEIKLFDNRLGFDISYYNRVTNDQILPIVASPSTGVNFRVVNFGKVRNRGIEISLTGVPIRTDDMTWNIGYTFTRNRNVVLELPDGLSKVVLNSAYDAQFVARVGQPLGVFEAPVPLYDPEGHIVVSSNGFPASAPDLGTYGSSQRDFVMGFTNTFTYKDFMLGFTLDFKKGGLFYSGTADLLNFVGNAANTVFNDRRTFIVPNSVVRVVDGDGKTTYVENTNPITENNIYSYYYTNSGRAVSYKDRIVDRTYLKLRDLTLGYSLPKKIARRIGTDRAMITLYGRNLLTWLPKQNITIDPEVSNFGNDLSSEFGEFRTGPSTRNFGVSLSLTF
jgi:outer membrane receptor protein involved in Fe transport